MTTHYSFHKGRLRLKRGERHYTLIGAWWCMGTNQVFKATPAEGWLEVSLSAFIEGVEILPSTRGSFWARYMVKQ